MTLSKNIDGKTRVKLLIQKRDGNVDIAFSSVNSFPDIKKTMRWTY